MWKGRVRCGFGSDLKVPFTLSVAQRSRRAARGGPSTSALRAYAQGERSVRETAPDSHMTTKPNALPWLLLSALVIALDQLSKWWALATLQPEGMPHPVIPGFLNW